MKNIFMIMVVVVMSSIDGYAQMGVKVEVPLTDLHVNGNMQVSKDIRLGGTATILGDPGKNGQILKSNGPDKAASWATLAIPEVPATSSGSLIAVNGNMQIAEEITYLMDTDFKFTETMTEPKIINTIDTKIIDTCNNI
ncbi:hypothetical protein VSO92_09240 [Myroides pelagicus]|uniref:hypothetical protein n=1 Tax=Myroides pelagicus TaxID=270914 RepID=UPI002DB72872|nr:hypothetical protein [Myroides pelagicus]MEC4114290.1 hypothetical protein [Myroides pelagicus]